MRTHHLSGLPRRVVSTIVAVIMAAAYIPLVSQPAYAATGYTGGVDSAPVMMLNDHTVYAVHFSATGGLPANTTLYVSAKLSDTGASGGFSNAPGFTWDGNNGTSRWVQSREVAASNGTVISDASGAASGWLYFKCGDEHFTGFPAGNGHAANQAYLVVQLQLGTSGSYNPSVLTPVTILDAATQGSWIHNGIATGVAAAKRADALSTDGTLQYSLQKTEANVCDDNDDGIVDNEDYGPAGATGDFLFGLPATTTVNVKLNQVAWTAGQGVTSGPADTDVAVGAADITPPSAPGDVLATAGNNSVALSWEAATDNVGVTGYRVYRKTGSAYPTTGTGDPSLTTPVPVLVASVGGSTTSYTDATAVNGTTYRYFVRAVDAATNAGPRSEAASSTPQPAPDTTAPTSSISGVVQGGTYSSPAQFTLSATDNSGGSGVAAIYYTIDGGSTQTYAGSAVSVTGAGSHTVTYWAVDNATNEELPHNSVTFTISTGAPTTSISGVVTGWSKTAETFTLTPAGDSAPFTTFYALNAGAPTTYTAPVPVSTQGTTTVTYWSVDSLGQSETPKTATIQIDGVAPVTTISGIADGGAYGTTVTFSLSAVDAASGIQQINYLVDNPSGSGALHPSGPVTLSGLAVGTHTVTYWSKDWANNTEARNTATFTVSVTAPGTTISGIAAGWSKTPQTFTLTTVGDAPPFTQLYTLNGGAVTTYTAPVAVSDQGTTTVSYWSIDSLGQTESPKTATIRIDGAAPVSTISGVADGGSYPAPAVFTLSAVDTVSGVQKIQYVVDSSPATQTFSAPVSVSGAGAHTVKFWAMDNAGNKESLHTVSFTVLPFYTLAYAADAGGSIEGSTTQVVLAGSDGTTVTAVPAAGYRFAGWSDGVTTAARADRGVAAAIAATATFSLVPATDDAAISYSRPVTILPLANDDPAVGHVASFTQPAHGTVVADSASGDVLHYTPAPAYLGTDTFTYVTTSGATATVTVTVLPGIGAPTGVGVSRVSSTTVTVSWTAPADTGSGLSGFQVAWRTGDASWTYGPKVYGPTDTSRQVTGLMPELTYEFKVVAWDTQDFSAESAPVSFLLTGDAPEPPANVTYDLASPTTTIVRWTGSARATGYRIYVNGVLAGTVGADATSFTIRGLLGPAVRVTVQALGQNGASSATAETKFTGSVTVKIGSVAFGGNSFALTATAKRTLRSLASLIVSRGFKSVTVESYTGRSRTGSAAFRARLAAARAASVRTYLLEQLKARHFTATVRTVAKPGTTIGFSLSWMNRRADILVR